MNKSLLVTRPDYDPATHYLYNWTELVIDEANKKQIRVYDLKDKKATRNMTISFLRAKHPGFLFFNGHGDSQCIVGDKNELLLDDTIDNNLLIGCILYARSCDSGKFLGSKLVQKGAAVFIGYNRKFLVVTTNVNLHNPLTDPLARLFLAPSNLIPTTILKGHSAEEAHNRSRREMMKNFFKMISSAASFEERYAARWLWSNIHSQILLGNSQTTLY